MPVFVTLAWTLVKKFWKEILILILLVVLAMAVHKAYEHIEDIGYQRGVAEKQKVIDAMLAQESKDNQALNDKITDLVNASKVAAGREFALQAQVQTKQTQIITQYVHDNPKSATSCAVDVPTVKAINQLLMADPAIVTQGAK